MRETYERPFSRGPYSIEQIVAKHEMLITIILVLNAGHNIAFLDCQQRKAEQNKKRSFRSEQDQNISFMH